MNGMPYYDMNMNPNGYQTNNNFNIIERINNRLNRLEKQVRILENRINNSNNYPQFIKNEYEDNNNMYML